MKPVAGLCPGFYQRNESAHLCGGGRYWFIVHDNNKGSHHVSSSVGGFDDIDIKSMELIMVNLEDLTQQKTDLLNGAQSWDKTKPLLDLLFNICEENHDSIMEHCDLFENFKELRRDAKSAMKKIFDNLLELQNSFNTTFEQGAVKTLIDAALSVRMDLPNYAPRIRDSISQISK